jgi:VanZ family protein
MSRKTAWALVTVLTIALLVGTQMPGGWRDGIESRVQAPFALSPWAHFVLFTNLAFLLAFRPIAWNTRRISLCLLALAIGTEVLQVFAVDRHPRIADVGIDMLGAVLGLLLAWAAMTRLRSA